MKRNNTYDGKPPVDVIRSVIKRLHQRSHQAWWEQWKDLEGMTYTPPVVDRIGSGTVQQDNTTWEYDNLDEWASEYGRSTATWATLDVTPSVGVWSVALHWAELSGVSLTVQAPQRADVLYVAEPLDQWIEQEKEAKRAAAAARKAEIERRVEEARKAKAEEERLAIPKPRYKRWWEWFRQTTNHQVIGALVAAGLLTGIGYLLKVLFG